MFYAQFGGAVWRWKWYGSQPGDRPEKAVEDSNGGHGCCGLLPGQLPEPMSREQLEYHILLQDSCNWCQNRLSPGRICRTCWP